MAVITGTARAVWQLFMMDGCSQPLWVVLFFQHLPVQPVSGESGSLS
jgi:hypothetical protein